MISLVIILPAARQADGNALAIAYGYDVAPGSTYSVALSATGAEPATHYACHTWASDDFVALLSAAASGAAVETPPGVSLAWLRGLLADMSISQMPEGSDPSTHFDNAAEALGLKRLAPLLV